ncbi:TonB-dependent receptor [Pseudomonadota bacterium]
MIQKTVLSTAIMAALVSMTGTTTVYAQDQSGDSGMLEEVVVTGIRKSMIDAMNVKRDATGVVDAVSAEDIGKFADTNLAESLQRIPGVSIDRVNGEGSKVTVRGFGPEFNLVTLNGRVMPTASVDTIGAFGPFGGSQGRSFAFDSIAAEGVSALEVYKTGQALLPSGGIGAVINILTRKPLDSGDVGSITLKGIYDSSVGNDGNKITPEISGAYNWVNDDETFGIGVFGQYSKRDSAAATAQTNDWVVKRANNFFADTSVVRAGSPQSNYINPPADGELYAQMQDSRYDYSQISRERINGQVVVQWNPTDSLRMTADYTFVDNKASENRAEQTNWFATPFDHITFDDGALGVKQMLYAQENRDGTKDIGFEQLNRAQKASIDSFGFNLQWDTADNQTLTFDAATSKAKAEPDNALGHTSTFVTFGAPVILQHSVDWTQGFPVQSYTYDDCVRGNCNGVIDVGDLGTQVQRYQIHSQENKLDELDLRYAFDWDSTRLVGGVNYRDSNVYVTDGGGQKELGGWGIPNPGDVNEFAPGVVEAYCLECQFNDYPVGQADTAFRGDATVLWPLLAAAYPDGAFSSSLAENTVKEKIWSYYLSFNWNTELMGKPFQLNAGLRYEDTKVTSIASQAVPTRVRWTADNDFTIDYSPDNENVSGSGNYDNWLPNIDLRWDLTDQIVTRFAYSKTIARNQYGSMYASTTAQAPNRPTVLGGQTGGNSGSPGILPLESTNFDLSFEWYFDDYSYVSVGWFHKDVKNFIGTGVFERPLFGLGDPTAGVPGSRSGDALDIIDSLGIDRSEPNLFTLVALIDANGGDVGAAQAEFQSNLVNGQLPQEYIDYILGLYDVVADANDPLMQFRVTQPINNDKGKIDGWEFQGQHFFGDSGWGISGSYTIVNGDVTADPAQDPNANQFALVGLSDTANANLIYENYGWQARLSYNWRDAFLNQTNVSGSRDPQFTDKYHQWDLAVSYMFNDHWSMQFEIINITGEDSRQYRRKENMMIYAYELDPRYSLAVAYRF